MKSKLTGAALLAAIAMPASAQTQVTYATYLCNNDVRLAEEKFDVVARSVATKQSRSVVRY